jgi:hypothetical protein
MHESSIIAEYRKTVKERDPDMDYESRLTILKQMCDDFIRSKSELTSFLNTPTTPMVYAPLILSPAIVIKTEPVEPAPVQQDDSDSDSDDSHSGDSDSDSDDSLNDRKLSSRDLLFEHAHKIRRLKRELRELRHMLCKRETNPVSSNVRRRGGATRYSNELKSVLNEAYNTQMRQGRLDSEGKVMMPAGDLLTVLIERSGLNESRIRKWFANRGYSQRKKELRRMKREQSRASR